MICPKCRKAGELNSQLEPGMTHVEKLIKAMHDDCDGGNWCDCQHVAGQALNLALINSGKSPAETEDAQADVLEPVELCSWYRQSQIATYAGFRLVPLN